MEHSVKRWIVCLSVTLAAGPIGAQEKSLVNVSGSPHAKMMGIDMNDVILTGGFWAERFAVCRDSMIPSMWRILNDPEISHAFRNFEIAAGTQEGCHRGPPFHDGDFYKWFESLAAVYLQTGDPSMDSLMDEIIPFIARSQRPDGYIHTPVIIGQANDPKAEPEFRERLDFETYNLGHLMTAACVHYRATGKESLLKVARKAADFLLAFYDRAPGELARNAICPSHYMGVTELYRTTGDTRYLELAGNLVEIRDSVGNGTDHNQDRIPFRQQTEAIGHAVRANYLYAGVADLVAETGDTTLFRPLESIWNDLVSHKLYITGGCGALYDGISPDGTSYEPSFIQQVHQAYGRPYQLPNITAHNESCANIGSVLWSWRMLMITAEAKYADLLERTLYNAVLPAVSLDGKRYFYTNPLRVNRDLPYTLRWSKEREEYISLCNCCPPNIVRTIAEIGSYMYSISDEGLWINLYGENVLETNLPGGEPLTLKQFTGYPWNGRIRIEMNTVPDLEFSLFLRIPAWADKASLLVNGKPGTLPLIPGQYCELRRNWEEGDVVILDIPMRVKLIRAHPLVEETSNQVAVQRGPIVYCLESPDLPEGLRFFELAIPAGIRFTGIETSIREAPMLALEGEAHRLILERDLDVPPIKEGLDKPGMKVDRDAPPMEKDPVWTEIVEGKEPDTGTGRDSRLYREVIPQKPERVKIRLIPYYAWGNRGRSEMTVWMAVDY